MFTLPRRVNLAYCFTPSWPHTAMQSLSNTSIRMKVNEQMETMEDSLSKGITDWDSFKQSILQKPGSMNEKNFEGVALKYIVKKKLIDNALSYAEHIKSKGDELSLGCINGILFVYYIASKHDKLSEKDKEFVLKMNDYLFKKYKVLDSTTSENLILALCAIGEWEKSTDILKNIYLTTTPSHTTFSSLIAALFNKDLKGKAFEMISESLSHNRSLNHIAYKAWIQYILRANKDQKHINEEFNKLYLHLKDNMVLLSEDSAKALKKAYQSVGHLAEETTISKTDGKCKTCKESLDCLSLTSDEFYYLQSNVKEKLIISSDLFLKSSPDELKRFVSFVEKFSPFDIVLDALNIAFSKQGPKNYDKGLVVAAAVQYFRNKNKKILVIGRKHMRKWDKRSIDYIFSNSTYFFTDDLSEDDPFFISAAILSGPDTDIVSRDLLRGHRFLLKSERLRAIFQRWQWQHQWMVNPAGRRLEFQPPLSFTPCAQMKKGVYHLPFEKDKKDKLGQTDYGIPDWSSWLCIQEPKNKL